MRKLKVKDIAPAIKLVNCINVGAEIKKIAKETKDANDAGVEIIGAILTKYASTPVAEKRLAEFLANPFEMTPEEVLDLDLDEFMENIKAIGGMNAIISFFGNALA